MIREVNLVSYLPPFMQQYQEPVAALDAQDPEFLLVWNATDQILYNHFISTANEYGISRFEKILGIIPSDDDTIESRRSRVQSKWFNTIPYTFKVLLQKLTILCGDTSFVLTKNFAENYTLQIETNLGLYGQVEELEYIIKTMIPCNIVIVSKNSIPCISEGTVFFGGGLCVVNNFMITNDFKEVFNVVGDASVIGGAVHTDNIMTTNDSISSNTVQGNAVVGGGTIETVKLLITQDFNENIQASNNANVGAGIVSVAFVEMSD
ncbi:MAG: putative phage tail protein [Lachnospiraceae bacterium]